MNKAFALAVLMSATMAGGAYAQEMGTAKPATNVAIVYTAPEVDNSGKRLDLPESVIHPTQATIDQAQAEVRHDGGLRAALVEKNVELNNVVSIETAADGSRIVYVR